MDAQFHTQFVKLVRNLMDGRRHHSGGGAAAEIAVACCMPWHELQIPRLVAGWDVWFPPAAGKQ